MTPRSAPLPVFWRFVLPLVATTIAARAQFVEPAQILVTITGPQPGDLFGWHVRSAGDVDTDGIADFAIASPFHDFNEGRVSMHSGATGQQVWSREATVTSAILGFELQTTDDLDNDGAREVIASAPFQGSGIVHVYSGRTGATLTTLSGYGDDFGYAIAADGDFNGDGIPDIAVGATADGTLSPNAGRIYVFSSTTFALVATLDPPPGVFRLGAALAFLGDVNGDRRDDLVVGSRTAASSTSGSLHVYSLLGSAVTILTTVGGVDHGSGIDTNHARPGRDFDGDLVPDIYLGEGSLARARVFSGASGGVLATFSDTAGDRFGTGGEGMVEDLNADGIPEVLVGAPFNQSQGVRNGRVRLMSGRDGRVLRTLTRTSANSLLGSDARLLPDRTNDGVPELLVAARGLGPGFGSPPTLGQVFVVAGDGCLAGWRNFGAGFAGTNGVPGLTAANDPILGSSWSVEVGNASGAPTIGFLGLGTRQANTPSPWGGTFRILPDVVLTLALGNSGLQVGLAVPPQPALCALDVFAQAVHLDSGAPQGIAESRGLWATLGR